MKRKSLIKNLFLATAAVFAVFFMTAGNAFAGGNDFKLSRLCSSSGCFSGVEDFKTLSQEYSSLLAPMHFAPAKTLGEEGFEIGVESKMSFSTKDNGSWKALNKNNPGGVLKAPTGTDDNGAATFAAPDLFATAQLHMRKGLPFSFEVEGVFNWLADSEIFYVGAGIRWAFTEGWWFMPDISVRAHAGTIVGASELQLINVNMDIAISYTWGLGGIVGITPYAGYSLLTSWASSRPLVLTAADGSTFEDVFSRINNHLSRAFVGVELKGDFFVFGVEGEFGDNVMSVGVKIGADF